jgi:hypothetical protein
VTQSLPEDTFDLAVSIATTADRQALHSRFVADHAHLHAAVVETFWDAACDRAEKLANPDR